MFRVVMVSDVYFPRVNGVSTSIQTFARLLKAEGIDLHLVAPDYGNADNNRQDSSNPDEAWITRVPARKVWLDPEDRAMHWHRLRDTLKTAVAGADLVHVQTPFLAHYAGLRAARSAGLPVICTYHTFFEEYLFHYLPFLPRERLRALARYVSRQQCNALDAVIVPSQAMRQRLGDYGITTPLEILPTGIPLERFAQGDGAAFRQRYGIAPARPVVLYVGRVAHEKNIGFLIEVMQAVARQLPQALLLIAGEGPAGHHLQQQVATAGLQQQVQFIGYLERTSELPACYAAADVFAFASRTETQGLVLLEAMAMGKPVVALSAMGTADILTPESGAVVPQDNVDDFAAKLAALLADPARQQVLGQQAHAWALQWSDRAMAARLAAFYRQQIDRQQASLR